MSHGWKLHLIDIHRFMTGEFVDAVSKQFSENFDHTVFKVRTRKRIPFKLKATSEQSLTRVGKFGVPHRTIGMSAHFGVDYERNL